MLSLGDIWRTVNNGRVLGTEVVRDETFVNIVGEGKVTILGKHTPFSAAGVLGRQVVESGIVGKDIRRIDKADKERSI